MWALHERLAADTFLIAECRLSSVLLMNNSLFPWLILVPRVADAREIIDLTAADRHVLMDEIATASQAMQALFKPHKLNVAALGNQVPQLHVHVIARFTHDAAWPNPVWGAGGKIYDNVDEAASRFRSFYI